ncbi:periplasmic divalent cation tolerance protein [CutA] [Thermoplasma volcanium GSS1]|uniref:Periplasmic divalent cation tolerance protein [CutA] n=1 Tax=Thermoplasma volcanium (strain ATCC 51530 / DSM 4299 / JCM 9571 / NBRC 15438 / GSS1) TaxID=273116 RepID=Q978J2_THEVO|nr:divalent-cation tolerance protein CutA [Thermoplasma volcanium]BAB60565.1 periplasmic divalent cation tolerance protein [CutA] [Thermoplasma volcanium GSS1]
MPFYVITTFQNAEEARRIGMMALEKQMAACFSIIDNVKSTYWWRGNIEESSEVFCVFKTTDDNEPLLSQFIKEMHNYEVPEIASMKMDKINEEYNRWLNDSCRHK